MEEKMRIEKKLLAGIFGGCIGFVVGVVAGGYFGLIVGGTFLGGFDIYENIGLEGYELAAYIFAIIGALAGTFLGIMVALKHYKRTKK